MSDTPETDAQEFYPPTGVLPQYGSLVRASLARELERANGRLTARLKAAVAVLDAITTPDGELALPQDEVAMARLETAFAAAKEVA